MSISTALQENNMTPSTFVRGLEGDKANLLAALNKAAAENDTKYFTQKEAYIGREKSFQRTHPTTETKQYDNTVKGIEHALNQELARITSRTSTTPGDKIVTPSGSKSQPIAVEVTETSKTVPGSGGITFTTAESVPPSLNTGMDIGPITQDLENAVKIREGMNSQDPLIAIIREQIDAIKEGSSYSKQIVVNTAKTTASENNVIKPAASPVVGEESVAFLSATSSRPAS